MTGGHPKPAVDRYLFLVAARGLRIAEVQAGPVFTTTFRAPWIPSAAIRAVRFTGAFYDVAEYPATVSFDEGTRALDVSVKADRSRYEPGDTVRLAVRVTDPRGRPVAASVALRAVDEKLYAMGFAEDTDLLAALYAGASDGVLATGVSHGARGEGAGEGDTTGGGGDEPRADFQDAILLRVVTTGRDGRASISFPLSDDLTSWHVSAAALDADMRAGSSSKLIPVGLPFFVEATLAQEYLAGDRPVLRVRGYGSDLKADADVRFTISSATLGMVERSVNARAFEAASVPLPTMTVGTHQVRIAAVTGTGPARHEDVLVRTITVVAHRAVVATSASGPLTEEFELQGGETGFTRIVLADGGRGRVVPGLLATVGVEPGRADTALAASLARRVLVDGFGMADDEFESMDAGAVSAFQPNSGVSLLPYGSEDLDLSALAALADDPGLDVDRLRDYFVEVVEAEEGQVTRERRIVALAGRAALGEAVLDEVREASAAPKLSLVERGWLALAALAAGDESLATSLERGLLEDAGQRLGPWARVVATDREETATLTALVAITAAGVGDPLAADLDAYLSSVPPTDTLVDLQRALAARSWAERTPAGDAVAQLTLDGAPRRLEIRASEPVLVSLTPAQLRTAGLAPVSGSVVVTTTWEGPLDPGSLEAHGIDGFSRTLKPAGKIGLTDVVIVEYRVRYGADGDLGSWLVSDFVPSGLAPIVSGGRLYDAEGNAPDIEGPWRVVGQRVDFTIAQRPDHATSTLRYLARVVTPGTYAWERVAIQSSIAPTWGRTVPATSLEIAAK